MNKLTLIKNGILDENPVLILVLGTCPSLAISVSVMGGIGMGIAATFVLICSNAAIALLRKVIPDTVRIPCYITVIAAFVTIVEMLVRTFMPALNAMLGIYLPLIVVNCIILGRAEMFASKNTVVDSIFDGLGMGLGFTLVLFCMGTVRELLGAGTWLGLRIIPAQFSFGFLQQAPGGFFIFGMLIALLTAILQKRNINAKAKMANKCLGCDGCDVCDNGEVTPS